MHTVFYVSAAAFTVTLLGGLCALHLQQHKALVYAFCAGALIGAAVILLLPDARALLEASDSGLPSDLVWLVCALGFLFFYLFQRDAHDGTASTRLVGLGGALGVATHSFLDGVVIGQGFQAGEKLGVILAIVVLFHKVADGVSAVGIMLGTEHDITETKTMLFVTALAPAAGAAAQSFLSLPTSLLALLLSWFAGMFLYLGASRLLPEARRTSSSLAVPALSVAGVAVAYLAHSLSR